MKRFWQLFIAVLICDLSPSLAGKILIYIPYAAKSSTMNAVTLANALEERGHKVTAVTAWAKLKFNKGKDYH